MEIIINRPVFTIAEGRARLSAAIEFPGAWEHAKEIFFETDDSLAGAFDQRSSDAFLVGILPLAMTRSSAADPLRIVVRGGLSRRLYHQVMMWYIPTLSHEMPDGYAPVQIVSEELVEPPASCGSKMVVTGISGGVDSTYTLVRHTQDDVALPLTHGAYFDFELDDEGEPTAKMETWAQHARSICGLYDLGFFRLRSNIVRDVYRMVHDKVVTSVFGSYALALQEGIGAFYFSSTVSFGETEFSPAAMSHYDVFNVQMFSTERLVFYSAGGEVDRLGKVAYLVEDGRTSSFLLPCSATSNSENCSICSKCTRTMCELDVLGKLDDYAERFDVARYRANLPYYWGYVLMKSPRDPFCRALLQECRARGYHVPLAAYPAAVQKWIKLGFRIENPLATSYTP